MAELSDDVDEDKGIFPLESCFGTFPEVEDCLTSRYFLIVGVIGSINLGKKVKLWRDSVSNGTHD